MSTGIEHLQTREYRAAARRVHEAAMPGVPSHAEQQVCLFFFPLCFVFLFVFEIWFLNPSELKREVPQMRGSVCLYFYMPLLAQVVFCRYFFVIECVGVDHKNVYEYRGRLP